jgi:hypothetical protein
LASRWQVAMRLASHASCSLPTGILLVLNSDIGRVNPRPKVQLEGLYQLKSNHL